MKNFIKKLAVGLSAVLVTMAVPYAAFAYGPTEGTAGRKYFDYGDTSTYPNYTAFNSFKNNPVWGFEPDFMSIKPTNSGHWADGDIIKLEPGQTYDVVVYYHNNAPEGTQPSKNARISIEFPSVVKAGINNTGNAVLTADNSTPNKIWTSLTFKTDSDMLIRYNQGSGEIHYNDGSVVKLPNEGKNLMNGGQLLGKNLDGVVYGCDDESAFIQFQITAAQPNFEASKQVRLVGTTNWSESVKTKTGDIVEFMLMYKNTGTTKDDNVLFVDKLPAGLEYVPGSTKIKNSSHPNGDSIADGITENGVLDPNTYNPGAATYILFQAKVTATVPDCESTVLKNIAKISTDLGQVDDPAEVIIESEVTECEPKEDPHCPTPGREHLPVDDPGCYDLPKTGPAEVITGTIAIAAVGTAAAYYIASRKKLAGKKK